MGNLTHTVSGDIASFRSAARVPIESLKCHFLLKQDLHGYSNPWPAGSGKNLIGNNFISDKTINNLGEIIVNTGGMISDYISVTSVSYVWSGMYEGANTMWNHRVHGYDENKNWVEQITYESVHNYDSNYNIVFTPNNNIKYVRLSFHKDTNKNQLEIGTVATSYEPYENICPIEGWNNCTTYKAGKNIGHIVAYSGGTMYNPHNTPYISGNYGNTLSTTSPERSVTITQTQWPETTTVYHYKNGYFCFQIDNLQFEHQYDISFKITNITNNPLNAQLSNVRISAPSGSHYGSPTILSDNTLIFSNVQFKQNKSKPQESDIAIYNCGMSCTFSEFMITPANMNDGVFEPYCGDIIPVTFPNINKNKLDVSESNADYIASMPNATIGNGTISTPQVQSGSSSYVMFKQTFFAGTYTLSGVPSGAGVSIMRLICDKEFEGGTYNNYYKAYWKDSTNNAVTFTVNEDFHIGVVLKTGTNYEAGSISNLQLELGEIATTYEPYNFDNTVYGGYVDIAAGEIVMTHYLACANKSDFDTEIISSSNSFS